MGTFPYARTLAALVLAASLGCSDGAGPLTSNLLVSFATFDPAATPRAAMLGAPGASGAALANDTLVDGTDTLIITRAEIVVREIELRRLDIASCDGEPEPPGCEEVEIGPVLVDLPLGPGAVAKFAAGLPAGAYSEITFEIHQVTNDAADAAFRTLHPGFP